MSNIIKAWVFFENFKDYDDSEVVAHPKNLIKDEILFCDPERKRIKQFKKKGTKKKVWKQYTHQNNIKRSDILVNLKILNNSIKHKMFR